MVSTPTTEPDEVRAGDTIKWKIELSDFLPSDGWTLNYTFINSSSKIEISSTDDSDSHLISVSATDSASWEAGEYAWTSYVSDGTDRYSIGTGYTKVLPDISQQSTHDFRSYAQKTLEAIEATLLGKASSDQKAMIIPFGGKRIDRYDVKELTDWRDRLRAELAIEKRGGRRRRILPSFPA